MSESFKNIAAGYLLRAARQLVEQLEANGREPSSVPTSLVAHSIMMVVKRGEAYCSDVEGCSPLALVMHELVTKMRLDQGYCPTCTEAPKLLIPGMKLCLDCSATYRELDEQGKL